MTRKILNGSFRTKADSITDNRAGHYNCATAICFFAPVKFFILLSICLIMAVKASDFNEYEHHIKILTISS